MRLFVVVVISWILVRKATKRQRVARAAGRFMTKPGSRELFDFLTELVARIGNTVAVDVWPLYECYLGLHSHTKYIFIDNLDNKNKHLYMH